MVATARALQVGERSYPVVLPSIRDPRLHLASVIIAIHVLGQLGLGFNVSIPQILSAIFTAAILEVILTFALVGALMWPASAMLTGSGVALILRDVGTVHGEYWSWRNWQTFALVAAFSVLTKYVFKFRGTHIFNPSNVGLVVAFLLLGSERVEPLDFWWSPLNGWMILAYAIILTGGILITSRLNLLSMGVAFWATLTAAVGVLAASGHCFVARWSFAPVCGSSFWWVIITSPEVLIFLFFMITDPKTTPRGNVARVAFGVAVAILATLLMAPQTTEFGAKVGLLAALVVVCAVRWLFDRLPAAGSEGDRIGAVAARFARTDGVTGGVTGLAGRIVITLGGVVVLAAAIVVAGIPARGTAEVPPDVLAEAGVVVDPAVVPEVTIDPEVARFSPDLATADGASALGLTLVENLEVESVALLESDPALLTGVDHGDRLVEMQNRLNDGISRGVVTVDRYSFDSMHLVVLQPFGMQSGLSAGIEGTGTVEHVTYDADGRATDSVTEPFTETFALRQVTGERWLLVSVAATSSQP
jgi:Na+-transporting NADH:ubiquinone oxidoreductase subunit NqrB